jgi:hypothetical protein
MSAVVWKMVPICILWCLWNERNIRCFEDLENSMEDIVALFFLMLSLWTEAFFELLNDTSRRDYSHYNPNTSLLGL